MASPIILLFIDNHLTLRKWCSTRLQHDFPLDTMISSFLIMDFSKAFEKLSHSLLVHKLEHYGIRGKTNNWIKNILHDRSQALILDGLTSNYISVDSGVPQGSLLGLSLFLLYINDIPQGVKSTVRLFADDTIAYLTITSENDALALQTDLNKLRIWEKK